MAATATFLAGQTDAETLAGKLGGVMAVELRGDGRAPVCAISTYAAGIERALCYQSLPVEQSSSGSEERVVVCSPQNEAGIRAAAKIVVADPRGAFMLLLQGIVGGMGLDYARTISAQADGIEPGDYDAHPTAVVEQPVIIGKGVVLGPHVVVRKGVVIGERTLVAPGTVIGTHGPAIHRLSDGRVLSWASLHVGTVHIGAGCELGTQDVVLRGILDQTRIGRHTILGNVVHIGHGVSVGEHVWMAAGCVVCGHCTVGDRATLGAGALLRDNIHIGESAAVGMGSVVVRDVEANESVLGNPAKPVPRRLKTGPDR
jgi:acetyltransferase-like isoleucine patch superfamily enzyme